MRPKTERKERPTTPGPGHYESSKFEQLLNKSPNIVVGHAKRSQDPIPAHPGPGHYAIPGTLSGPKWGFGSEQKSKTLSQSFPSPGDYNLPDGSDRRAYSMMGKHQEKPGDAVPGPGSYSPTGLQKAPAYSVGHGSRSDFTGNEGPGPGQYSATQRPSSGVK